MYRAVLLLALAAAATAFAPSAMHRRTTALSAGAKSAAMPFLPQPAALDGSMVGDVGFDPLGITSIDNDFSTWLMPEMWMLEDRPGLTMVQWARESELKHGRICMLAFTGYLSVDLGMRLPGAKFADIASSASAHDAGVASGAMGLGLLALGMIEVISGVAIVQMANGSGRAPGDFGFDPLGFLDGSEEAKADMALKEITHCRLAMLGFAGIVTQSNCVNDQFPYFPVEFFDQSTMINAL